MENFISLYWESTLTIILIFSIVLFPYERVFKTTDYNAKGMYEEGYSKAEESIRKGSDPKKLIDQCPGVMDKWDKGFLAACKDAIK